MLEYVERPNDVEQEGHQGEEEEVPRNGKVWLSLAQDFAGRSRWIMGNTVFVVCCAGWVNFPWEVSTWPVLHTRRTLPGHDVVRAC